MQSSSRKAILNVAAAFVLLLVLAYLVGWGEIFAAIRGSSPNLVLLGLIAGVGATLARSATWFVFFPMFGYDYSPLELLRVYYAGGFANKITPLGQLGGEPFLAYLLSKGSDVSYEKHFGSIFASDIVNAVPIFTLSVAGLVFFVSLYPSQPVVSSLAALIIGVTGIVVAFLLSTWHMKETVKKVAGRIRRGVKFVIGFVTGFIQGEGVKLVYVDDSGVEERIDRFYEVVEFAFSHKKEVVEALIISHAARFLDVLSVYSFVVAAGFKPDLLSILFIVPVAGLAQFIPMPGGLGSLDVAMVGMLVLIANVPWPVASAAVLLYRVSTYGVMMTVGGFSAFTLSRSRYRD